jgi:hypothetical protein
MLYDKTRTLGEYRARLPHAAYPATEEWAFHGAICIVACSWLDLAVGGWLGNEGGYPARKGNDT